MTFGENLKRICEMQGTTPTAVCKELGLSTSKVSAWYNGSIPKQDIMLSLAKKLNCSVMDFFADEEDLSSETENLNDDEKDIIRIYRSLPRREQHELMAKVYEFDKEKP